MDAGPPVLGVILSIGDLKRVGPLHEEPIFCIFIHQLSLLTLLEVCLGGFRAVSGGGKLVMHTLRLATCLPVKTLAVSVILALEVAGSGFLCSLLGTQFLFLDIGHSSLVYRYIDTVNPAVGAPASLSGVIYPRVCAHAPGQLCIATAPQHMKGQVVTCGKAGHSLDVDFFGKP